jgi:hypothetical protein
VGMSLKRVVSFTSLHVSVDVLGHTLPRTIIGRPQANSYPLTLPWTLLHCVFIRMPLWSTLLVCPQFLPALTHTHPHICCKVFDDEE